MLDKLQQYLKLRHKFDKKLDYRDRWEILDKYWTALKIADKADNRADIRKNYGLLFVELIKLANIYNVDISTLISEDMKIKLN